MEKLEMLYDHYKETFVDSLQVVPSSEIKILLFLVH